ncbi:MAG: outer membrane beta-barrel protein [Acidobacteria bacterium]|nr:outer membrane beta-barrel protein [Acidobacteriota bacterium]
MFRTQVLLLMVCSVVGVAAPAVAQPQRVGLEVGAHFESLHVDDAGSISTGIGGRLTVAVAPWLAIEGELTFFPRDDYKVTSRINGEDVGIIYNRRRVDALVGVKAGMRGPRVGVFGRVRPGFTRLTDRGVDCLQVCALILIAPPKYDTALALDLGGTVELHWTPSTLMRFDVGDTMIRNRADATAPPFSSGTTHNFTTRVGVGFRF